MVVAVTFVLKFIAKELVMNTVKLIYDILKMVAGACVVMLGARLRDQRNSGSLELLSV